MTVRVRVDGVAYWSRGTQIMWRYGAPGLDFAAPMIVVADDERALVAWLPMGTPVLKLVRADGRELRADPSDGFLVERRQVEAVWEGYSVLRIHEPGRWWSTWVFFHGGTGAFEGWYVNIEDPHVREGRTTRSRDHVLDVWVEPDRTVERKDEAELVLTVEQGRYTQAEADAITAVADEVEQVIGAWGAPFCDGWESFRPDPAWPVPALPAEPGRPSPS
jgi:hypothetical protein